MADGAEGGFDSLFRVHPKVAAALRTRFPRPVLRPTPIQARVRCLWNFFIYLHFLFLTEKYEVIYLFQVQN